MLHYGKQECICNSMYVHVYVECIIYNGVMFVNIAIIFKVTTKLLTIKHDDDSVRQRVIKIYTSL